jgi:hypothetical protein
LLSIQASQKLNREDRCRWNILVIPALRRLRKNNQGCIWYSRPARTHLKKLHKYKTQNELKMESQELFSPRVRKLHTHWRNTTQDMHMSWPRLCVNFIKNLTLNSLSIYPFM